MPHGKTQKLIHQIILCTIWWKNSYQLDDGSNASYLIAASSWNDLGEIQRVYINPIYTCILNDFFHIPLAQGSLVISLPYDWEWMTCLAVMRFFVQLHTKVLWWHQISRMKRNNEKLEDRLKSIPIVSTK